MAEWYTRTFEGRVEKSVRVQVPSSTFINIFEQYKAGDQPDINIIGKAYNNNTGKIQRVKIIGVTFDELNLIDLAQKTPIEDILKSKKLLEEKCQKPYYSKLFNSEIEIEDIPMDKVAKILNKANEEEPIKTDLEIIYESCPIFRSKELQSNYDISDPMDIIGKVFCQNIQEIDNLAKHIMKRYGYFTEAIETIKKQ